MTTHRRSLTIFQVPRSIDGTAVTDFDQVVLDSVLNDPALQTSDVTVDQEFEARLYVIAPPASEPGWAEFLHDGFGASFALTPSASNKALLVIRFSYYSADRYFAITFGSGRYMMRRNAFIRSFGLKTALNLIYEGDQLDGSASFDRVRQVDSKTVAGNTFRTRRQANRYTNFEQFGLDTARDLLNTVTGEPIDRTEWGSRVFGADQVGVNVPLAFDELGALCKRLWRAGRADDYEVHFKWIDNLSAITAPSTLERLRNNVAQSLRDGTTDLFELAPPELVDWDEIETFQFEIGAATAAFDDLTLADYRQFVDDQGLTAALDWQRLKDHRVSALDAGGEELYRWPISLCLFGELDDDGERILFDSGDFLAVAAEFLDDLDNFIAAIPESTVDLPDSRRVNGKEITEGQYNEEAAAHLPTNLLLDKRTVRVATSTSPIEVCDVLTTDRKFVHVKRKLGSASLSHLFGQGYVSGDLFIASPGYRAAVAAEIHAAEADKGSGPIFTNSLDFDHPDSASIEVVYAVVADWNGDSVVDRLPFFSKVNLRRHTTDLRRMGYQVTFKKIDIA